MPPRPYYPPPPPYAAMNQMMQQRGHMVNINMMGPRIYPADQALIRSVQRPTHFLFRKWFYRRVYFIPIR